MLIDGVTTDVLPASDRGLAYGDGLFETFRLHNGKLLFLDEHLERLRSGCKTLQMQADYRQIQHWLQVAVASAPADAVVKLILTRGSGGRGYALPKSASPRCLISVHPLPPDSVPPAYAGIQATVCQQRLAWQPALAGIKHLNRLEQVLASTELVDTSYHEGLMLDYAEHLIEGTRSNIFISLQGKLLTPDLEGCGINGVMRKKLLELFGSEVSIANIKVEDIAKAEEIFAVNSVVGVWPIIQLLHGSQTTNFPVGPFAAAARTYFNKALQS